MIPLKQIMFSTLISVIAVQLHAGEALPPRSTALKVQFSELYGIFSEGDRKTVSLSLDGGESLPEEAIVSMNVKGPSGQPSPDLDQKVVLKKDNGYSAEFDFDAKVGYYEVSYDVSAKSDGANLGEGSFSCAVLPDNPVPGKDPNSPFGVCTHFNQGWPADMAKVVKKAGIAWIYNDVNMLDDVVVPIAKANNLCYLPLFSWYKTPDPEDKDKDGNWDFSNIVAQYRAYAKKYRKDIDVYDLCGEPHGPWGAEFGGGWDGGPWQKNFVEFALEATKAIKEEDPGAKVLWEDIDMLLWYRQFHLLGVGNEIDLIGPHSYNLHRSNPNPEDHPMLKQLPAFHRFVKRHNLTWRVWADEVGFSSFRLEETSPGHHYTPCTELEQAQLLVRAFVSQLANGVDKIFWYDFRNDGQDPTWQEHNFGLVRYDGSPKPSLVAYSKLIDELRGAKWLGSYPIGGGGLAYVYLHRSGVPRLVAWLRNGETTELLQIPSRQKNLQEEDIFGNKRTAQVVDHQYSIGLSETPVFVDGFSMEDLEPVLERYEESE